MPKLKNFPTAKQAKKNSCWACSAREINNYYNSHGKSGDNGTYDTDQELADAWAKESGDDDNEDINTPQSAIAAVEDLGYETKGDTKPIPTKEEITDEINDGIPLLMNVFTEAPEGGKPNPNVEGGHWVVIIGINEDGSKITVFDPDDGQEHEVDYDASEYKNPQYDTQYWQNTSYINPQ